MQVNFICDHVDLSSVSVFSGFIPVCVSTLFSITHDMLLMTDLYSCV